MEDVILKAHECGGIVFLAHIDEYQSISDKDAFLENLVTDYSVDGIEVYHPSISQEHNEKYKAFAKKHNLLISCGSDFHGPHLEHRKTINTKAKLDEVSWLEEARLLTK